MAGKGQGTSGVAPKRRRGPTGECQTDELKERKTPSSARGERLLPDTLHSAANDERESGKNKENQKIQQTR